MIKELNPSTREISVLTPAVEGSTEADTAWTPDGTLLMVKGTALYGWKRGESGWKEITTLERLGLPRRHAARREPQRGLAGARRPAAAEPLIYCRWGSRR